MSPPLQKTNQSNVHLHFKNPAKRLICFRILFHCQWYIHPRRSYFLKGSLQQNFERSQPRWLKVFFSQDHRKSCTYLADNDRRIPDRINIRDRSLVFWEEFPENWFIFFGLDVEKWKCGAKVVLGQIWYGLDNDVIWFCHEYITVHMYVNQRLIKTQRARKCRKSHINVSLRTLPQFLPFEATAQMPRVCWALCSPNIIGRNIKHRIVRNNRNCLNTEHEKVSSELNLTSPL